MRWIVNENVSGTVFRTMRERGHDVLSVKESLRGTGDSDILGRAQAEQRVLVTHDKDFGELAFRFGLPATSGVILVSAGRFPEHDSREISRVAMPKPAQEDQCRVRVGHADANFSILRRTALSLLKNNHSLKVGVKNKRLAAAWDDSHLERVLFGQ